jgi:hypothetical protein
MHDQAAPRRRLSAASVQEPDQVDLHAQHAAHSNGMKTDPSGVRIAGVSPSDVNDTMDAVLVVEIEGDAVQR